MPDETITEEFWTVDVGPQAGKRWRRREDAPVRAFRIWVTTHTTTTARGGEEQQDG